DALLPRLVGRGRRGRRRHDPTPGVKVPGGFPCALQPITPPRGFPTQVSAAHSRPIVLRISSRHLLRRHLQSYFTSVNCDPDEPASLRNYSASLDFHRRPEVRVLARITSRSAPEWTRPRCE